MRNDHKPINIRTHYVYSRVSAGMNAASLGPRAGRSTRVKSNQVPMTKMKTERKNGVSRDICETRFVVLTQYSSFTHEI